VVVLAAPAVAEERKRTPEATEEERREDHRPLSPVDGNEPGLAKQIVLDFKNVFTTKENLYILGAGAGASLFGHQFDSRIPTSPFNGELFEGGALDRTFDSGNTVGGALFQAGAAVATFAVGKATHDPELASVGRDLIRAQIVTQGLTQAIKYSVSRTRPDESGNTSFPSGHTSSAFATATVLQRHYGWKVGGPAYALAGFVAAARLNENKHYLSDVIFGATVGIIGGRTVTLGIGGSRFALSPMFVPGGAGVQLSLVN
jgi:membrane-associated phospholipid phosphatase